MKVIVAGGRDFNNYPIVEQILNRIKYQITEIVSGDAKGADTLGAHWANYNSIPVKHFPAKWERYGKSAGFIRNAEMADYADMLIAFWDGKSHGTANMINTAKAKCMPYYVYNYNGELIIKGWVE